MTWSKSSRTLKEMTILFPCFFILFFMLPIRSCQCTYFFYPAQAPVFSRFLCELMSTCQKTSQSGKRRLSARLMNWSDLKSCLMSARGKAKECAGLCGQEPCIRSEVGSLSWQGGYRSKSYPLLHQQGIHFTPFSSWKHSHCYRPGKKLWFYFCIAVAKSYKK